jgi:micrococcal nuclease
MDRVEAVIAVVALVALAGCGGLGAESTDSPAPTLPSDGTLEPDAGTEATVVDVVDGDTVDVRYSNGTTDTVRLLGVDSPEVYSDNSPGEFEGVPDTDEGRNCLEAAGEAATDFAETHLSGETVTVVVDDTADRRDRYGRLLAYVHVDGAEFNYRLVANGHARVYDTTFARADGYYAAESEAQDGAAGLWACRTDAGGSDNGDGDPTDGTEGATPLVVDSMQADAPGNDHENRNGEYVEFRNEGDEPLDVGGWTVSDEAGHTYTFPDGFVLGPGASVTLRTGDGTDTTETLYWGADGAVWNNGGDAVVVSRDGETALTYTYG